MNNENLDFLNECLKYLGFGDKLFLHQELAEYITREAIAFELQTEVIFEESKKLEVTLHFRRSEQFETYFFHKYQARLRSGIDSDLYRVQTFYITKERGVTLKEAFNLLEGRAVNKNLINFDGQKYNAWLQLNFAEKDSHDNYKVTQFRPQYGYDLERTLERYPIRQLQDAELKAALLRSLRKGNRHLVNFDKPTKSERMSVEANPALRTINIYPVRSCQPARQNDSGK